MNDGTAERWLPVVGYEGIYEVSDHGRIWSMPRPGTRGGILRPYYHKNGYVIITLTLDGKQKDRRIHQLVIEAFTGPPPDGQEVRHLDGDSTHNFATNLAWGTRKENEDDKRRHGTHHETVRTFCDQGHPYDEDNTRIVNGHRECKACKRIYGQRFYQKNRGAILAAYRPAASLTSEELAERRAKNAAAMRRHRARKKLNGSE